MQKQSSLNIEALSLMKFAHIKYLKCYRCQYSKWPQSFSELVSYNPKGAVCIGVKEELNYSGGFRLFEEHKSAQISSISEIGIEVRIREKTHLDGTVEDISPIKIELSIRGDCTEFYNKQNWN